jgi:hypothetical protein
VSAHSEWELDLNAKEANFDYEILVWDCSIEPFRYP